MPNYPNVVIHGTCYELQQPHLTDAQVANGVRMLMRDQINHEAICTLGRDRILYLSQQLETALGLIEELTTEARNTGPARLRAIEFVNQPRTKPSLVEKIYERP